MKPPVAVGLGALALGSAVLLWPRSASASSMMTTSAEGLAAIRHHEGFSSHLYTDQAGHTTIGVGHLVHRGGINGSEPARFQRGISAQEADELLAEDVKKFEKAVLRNVSVPLSQGQFDALVSFTFNLGTGALRSSSLLRKLNQGDYSGAAQEFASWNKVRIGGNLVPSPGLSARRADETARFLA